MLRDLPRQIILILYSLLILVPLSLILFTTFKTTPELYGSPLSLPSSLSFDNYRRLFANESMAVYFSNSVFVTLTTVISVLFIGSMLAYAISRLGGWLPTAMFAFLVAGLMVAPQVYMITLYILLDTMGLVNSLIGVILASIASQLPIATLLLTGFMRGLPKEMIDAAFVDGATEWSVYRRVVLPLTKPALASLAIFSFVITWNDLLFPLIFLQSDINKTLPLALLEFRGQYLTDYPLLFSGVLVATLPMLLAYVLLQRYFIEGMTAGSVKG